MMSMIAAAAAGAVAKRAVSDALSAFLVDDGALMMPAFAGPHAASFVRARPSLGWSESDHVPPLAVGWDRRFESISLRQRVRSKDIAEYLATELSGSIPVVTRREVLSRPRLV
jgi:hypothetical protein